MKRLFLLVGIGILIAITIAMTQFLSSTLHFSNRVKLNGTNHRIVVVVNPSTVSGGVVVLDKTFNVSGSSTTINASIVCEIE